MKNYIDYLDSKDGFKQKRKEFKNLESAISWLKANFEKWNLDMINYF